MQELVVQAHRFIPPSTNSHVGVSPVQAGLHVGMSLHVPETGSHAIRVGQV